MSAMSCVFGPCCLVCTCVCSLVRAVHLVHLGCACVGTRRECMHVCVHLCAVPLHSLRVCLAVLGCLVWHVAHAFVCVCHVCVCVWQRSLGAADRADVRTHARTHARTHIWQKRHWRCQHGYNTLASSLLCSTHRCTPVCSLRSGSLCGVEWQDVLRCMRAYTRIFLCSLSLYLSVSLSLCLPSPPPLS